MLVTYLRSSSVNSILDWCPQQGYLVYNIGLVNPSKKKTEKGSITHKALELLAYKKLAIQNNQTSFFEPEFDRTFYIDEITPEFVMDKSWEFYTKKCTHIDWEDKDLEDCRKYLDDTLKFNNGMFSPLNRHIVAPEQYFDFTIEEPWAKYDYQVGDQRLSGYLSVKGSVDLVTKLDDDTIELIDWKTGQAKDWATGQRKGYHKLENDFQLRLYHYALQRLYPTVRDILVTIFFIRDGGPTSICFHPEDGEKTLAIIREKFEKIKGIKRPKIITKGSELWRCKYLCRFYKEKQPGSDKSICRFFKDEIVKLGIDRVTELYGDLNKLQNYGAGGGKEAKLNVDNS